MIFGLKGNVAPTLFSWINLMGWEAVNVITGTLTLAALFEAFGLGSSHLLTALSLLLFGGSLSSSACWGKIPWSGCKAGSAASSAP